MRLHFPSETSEEAEERDDKLFRDVRGARNWNLFERMAGDQEDKGFSRKGLRKFQKTP